MRRSDISTGDQADFRRKSSSFSLQLQLEQLRQQKIKTPTPTVMSAASRVPNESKVCGERCMVNTLSDRTVLAMPEFQGLDGRLAMPKIKVHETLVSSSVALDSRA
jgi:hypothetical protein